MQKSDTGRELAASRAFLGGGGWVAQATLACRLQYLGAERPSRGLGVGGCWSDL